MCRLTDPLVYMPVCQLGLHWTGPGLGTPLQRVAPVYHIDANDLSVMTDSFRKTLKRLKIFGMCNIKSIRPTKPRKTTIFETKMNQKV